VIGGGPYIGAVGAGRASCGADLVRVACPRTVACELQGYSENLIVRPFEGEHLAPLHVDTIYDLVVEHDSVVLGPGLGDDEATLDAVGDLLERYDGTAVVDTDALQVVPETETDADLLCTPHQGKLEAMGGKTASDWRDRAELVERYAAQIGQTLLVKGPYDIVFWASR